MRVQELLDKITERQFASINSMCKKFKAGIKLDRDVDKALKNPKFARFMRMYPQLALQAQRWQMAYDFGKMHQSTTKFVMPAISTGEIAECDQEASFLFFEDLAKLTVEGCYAFEQNVIGDDDLAIVCYVSFSDDLVFIKVIELCSSRVSGTDLQFIYWPEKDEVYCQVEEAIPSVTLDVHLGDTIAHLKPVGKNVLYVGPDDKRLHKQRMMECKLIENSLMTLKEYLERINKPVKVEKKEESLDTTEKKSAPSKGTSGVMVENEDVLVPLSSIGRRTSVNSGARGPLDHPRKSPRAHDVRGHYRTYKSGKTIWVKSYATGKCGAGGKIARSILVDTL